MATVNMQLQTYTSSYELYLARACTSSWVLRHLGPDKHCPMADIDMCLTDSHGSWVRSERAHQADQSYAKVLAVSAEPADEPAEEDKEAAPKTKKETQWSWDLLNDNKAIWLRSAKDVDEEEYDKFYQTLSKVQHSFCQAAGFECCWT